MSEFEQAVTLSLEAIETFQQLHLNMLYTLTFLLSVLLGVNIWISSK